jgi:hypothetical protein
MVGAAFNIPWYQFSGMGGESTFKMALQRWSWYGARYASYFTIVSVGIFIRSQYDSLRT